MLSFSSSTRNTLLLKLKAPPCTWKAREIDDDVTSLEPTKQLAKHNV
jgi:hypothetical protein